MKKRMTKLLLGAVLVACFAGNGKVHTVHGDITMPEPVLRYDFEGETEAKVVTDKMGSQDAALVGRVNIQHVPAIQSDALYLMGIKGYLEFPQGFFDGRDTMTISMDVCSLMDSENFFTVAIGKDNTEYLFLRTRSGEIRYAITKDSWGAEDDILTTGEFKEKWVNVTLVLDGNVMRLYVDGECVDEQAALRTRISDFGSGVTGYLGKSFYDGDKYFKGYIDNVCVYDTALSSTQIALMNGVEMTPFREVRVAGAETSLVTYQVDKEEKNLKVYTSRSAGAGGDSVELQFTMQDYATLLTSGNIVIPYQGETEVAFEMAAGAEKRTENWTVTAEVCNNPVLKGQYADPDIDVFGDTYYLYTTTDGFAGWSGTQFHVFSSKNLVDWTDEGVILDVAKGKDVAWSVGNAWAPSIEEKNGTYYFYFCAKDEAGDSHIGVAVADAPTGPFVAAEEPLMTVAMCKSRGVSMGQAIDPSIFTDEDGTSYLLFGNGAAAVVKLNEDMVSCDLSTLKNYRGMNEFREAITVTKRGGIYHFTWSCDDTGSPDYHVNYGTSDSIYGPIDKQYTILQKNAELDILGTGHHSILQIPGEDEYYIAYHRFFTPLGFFSDGTGHHRQTCIDKLDFGEDGLMEAVVPTLEGVEARILSSEEESAEEVMTNPGTEIAGEKVPEPGTQEDAAPVIETQARESRPLIVYVVAGVVGIVIIAMVVVALNRKKEE